MKDVQKSLASFFGGNKVIVFLVAVTLISIIAILVSGYRLLFFDAEKYYQQQLANLDDLQVQVADVSPAIVSFDSGNIAAITRLNQLTQRISDNWSALQQNTVFTEIAKRETQTAIDELLVYVRDRLAGQRVDEFPVPIAKRAYIALDVHRLELQSQTSSPYSVNDVWTIVICVILISLALVTIFFNNLKESNRKVVRLDSEGKNNQAAIQRLLDELDDLAEGDLTVSATVSGDFTGAIADSINFTIDQLRQLVSRINNTAVRVSQAAQSSQQTALHLAKASDRQAQEITDTSVAINEMAVMIDQVSTNASESALVAGKSVSIANNGAKLVRNTIHGMGTIQEQIQDTSERIKRLGESSQQIGDIVSLINDIADQTNLLALNAAVQASMAGDAGSGFAVVADEVQRLAERSAAATKQIKSLVKTIQTDNNKVVVSMEQTISEVVRGAGLAQDAGVALEEIEGVSVALAELIKNISNAARQQATSAGQISSTMSVIQEITSQTSSGTVTTAKSIGALAAMAMELRESVAGFTLPQETSHPVIKARREPEPEPEQISLKDAEPMLSQLIPQQC